MVTNRRGFVKQVLGAAAIGAAAPKMAWEQSPKDAGDCRTDACACGQTMCGDRAASSATIAVRLVEEQPGRTSVSLTEHGDADYVIVEAFYWTTFDNQRILLHKETTAPLVKGMTTGADLPMPVASIVFLRVKEMKLLRESEFGKLPSTAP